MLNDHSKVTNIVCNQLEYALTLYKGDTAMIHGTQIWTLVINAHIVWFYSDKNSFCLAYWIVFTTVAILF